jgi:chromosome segregation ATPase
MSERTIPTLEEIAANRAHRFSLPVIDAELAAVLLVHNRRLDALEQQARAYQEDGHLAVDEFREPTTLERTLADVNANWQQRAEAAERERDEWKAEAARAWSEYSRKLDELVIRTTQREDTENRRALAEQAYKDTVRSWELLGSQMETAEAERDSARATVERLSAALRKVEKCTGCNACRGIAYDALKETPDA